MYNSIAIDGPSGVGKSTVAKFLAEKLGYIHVDTGAMFRALAVCLLENGIDAGDEERIEKALPGINISIGHIDGEQHVFLNGADVTGKLRSAKVSQMASISSQYRAVRAKLLDLQREAARLNDVIMDGRDIGTVVLPDATLKIFLTARPRVRAERRYNQLREQGRLEGETVCSIERAMAERDRRDSLRENAPLIKASDAVELDTSDMGLEEVFETILSLFDKKLSGR